MPRIFYLVLILFCFRLAPLAAQEQSPETHYAALLERVHAYDTTVDFTDLRLTYARTASYDPNDDPEVQKRMHEALNGRDFKKGVTHADTLLAANYLSIEAHFACAVAYHELGQEARSDYHSWMVNRLLRSILESGEGTSPESPFVVISVAEEYALIQLYGLEPSGQKLDHFNGIPMDIMNVTDPETKGKHTFYFDISRPMIYLAKMLEGIDMKGGKGK